MRRISTKNRIIALALCFLMALSLIPGNAFAEASGNAVDFYSPQFNVYYSIPGNESINLSDLLIKWEINDNIDVSQVTSVVSSDSESLEVTKLENDWQLTSKGAFEGEITLTIDGGYNTVITATWATTNKLAFNYNGGAMAGYPDTTSGSCTVLNEKPHYSDVSWLNPVRPGYTFEGWYIENTDVQVYDKDGYCIPETNYWNSNKEWSGTSDLNLYARWSENIYTITYELGEGELPENTSNPQTYTITSNITLPTPTLANHAFAGWKVTGADGNWPQDESVSAGEVTGKYGNVTLTAQWTPQYVFNVTYEKGDAGDSEVILPENIENQVQSDPTYNIPLSIPSRENYTITGWDLIAEGNCDWNFNATQSASDNSVQIVAQSPGTINITATPRWTRAYGDVKICLEIVNNEHEDVTYSYQDYTYTIAADDSTSLNYTVTPYGNAHLDQNNHKIGLKDGGDYVLITNLPAGAVVTVTQDANQTQTQNVTVDNNDATTQEIKFTKGVAHYSIKHYQQNVEGTGYDWVDTVEAEHGTTNDFYGMIGEPAEIKNEYIKSYTGFHHNNTQMDVRPNIKADGTTAVEIYYDRDVYTVTFNGEGADPGTNMEQQTYLFGKEKNLNKLLFTKIGYTFKGWESNILQDPEKPNGPKIWFKDQQKITLSDYGQQSVGLWSKWDPIKYTITYDTTENGYLESNVQQYDYDQEVELRKPQKKGYFFAGWKATEVGEVNSIWKLGENDHLWEKDKVYDDLKLGYHWLGDVKMEAQWVPNVEDLKISTVLNVTDTKYADQSFVFYIEAIPDDPTLGDKDNPITFTVALVGTDSVTIKDAPAGMYYISEISGDWTWRYEVNMGQPTISVNIDEEPEAPEVTFTFNDPSKELWLNGFSYKEN